MNIELSNNQEIVSVIGLGFVGAATAVAIANAKDSSGENQFHVIGIDAPTPQGIERIKSINRGEFPFITVDSKLKSALTNAIKNDNLFATEKKDALKKSSITLVCVNLDVNESNGHVSVDLTNMKEIIRELGYNMPSGSLIIIQTTVPPGTCIEIFEPIIKDCLKERKLPENDILLAHSYERVMPGKNYLDSIVNFWRVYSGNISKAADKCNNFLSKIINVEKYPLTRLDSTTASETAKVLENSYRAVNIAFIEEWSRYAENIGIDLFPVLDAIRVRPTHSNIMYPGFGVGGYCLTKDPLFGKISATEIFNLTEKNFPFSTQAIQTNDNMPLHVIRKMKRIIGGNIEGKKILLLGVTYRQNIGDTRNSPAAVFVSKVTEEGAEIFLHDPLINYWPEMDMKINQELPEPSVFDAVIFTVAHSFYRELDINSWIGDSDVTLIDANNVLTEKQRQSLSESKSFLYSVGRG